MNFSTTVFLFILLPVTFVLYGGATLTKNMKIKNFILLLVSIVFYGWCGIQYLILLLALIGISFFCTQKMQKTERKKQWLVSNLILNLVVLGFFKYFNFFVDNIEGLLSVLTKTAVSLQVPAIPLPLGISFFIFQIIAFSVDVYRGKTKEDSLIDYALYIMFFPQLVQGPILRHKEMSAELKKRIIQPENLNCGARRFMIGFCKKVLIADKMVAMSNATFGLTETGLPLGYAWLGILCYGFLIYFDFSGYSDMAIGLCEMFGFHISENFNYPYISRNIQEFWRRWHISLSSWFRDYIYIPLGGNRVEKWKIYRNLLVVFLLTGVWHGANWTFIVWGIFHGVFMLLERMGLKKCLEKIPLVFQHIYTLVVVLVGWVFFRADSFLQALAYIKAMFVPNGVTYVQMSVLKLVNKEFVVTFLLAMIFSTPIMKKVFGEKAVKELKWVGDVVGVVLFVYAISTMLSTSFSPSIYSKF